MENLTLKWARKYLKLKWSIIPIRAKGKEPLVKWEEFQERQPTLNEVTQWLSNWSQMNLGIVTGSISSLAVVDLDGIEGVQYGNHISCVSGIINRTGNGKQVFYKWQPGIKNSVKKVAPGVDIRGEGGFVVVAPSIHPSGRMYRWERFVPDRIPDFPTTLLSAMNTDSIRTKTLDVKQESWISQALEEMKNGHVHNNLVSVLGRFRHNNFSVDDTVALLKPYANEGGMSTEELQAKTEEIWGRYEHTSRSLPGQQAGLLVRNLGSLSIKSPTNDNDFEQFNAGLRDTKDLDYRRLISGFPTLDHYCEGGLKSERLFTIAARTGVGKTNCAIALAKNLCEQGKKVLFFSTEFQYSKIWGRYMALLKRHEEFRRHAFYVCDSFSPNLSQVEEAIKQVMPDVFIFDHINHISEERESLGAFMQGANFLQRKYMSQGVMVAQLSRQADWVENGKRIEPRMSMVKGSGTIEQASSRVLLLSEVRITPEYNEIDAILDKNDSGDRGKFSLALYKNPYRMVEL
jgi:hypothetical protein